MKTAVFWDKEDVILGVVVARRQNRNLYGPVSYPVLSDVIAQALHVDAGPAKSTLSRLVNGLLEEGKLAGERDENDNVITATLHVPRPNSNA